MRIWIPTVLAMLLCGMATAQPQQSRQSSQSKIGNQNSEVSLTILPAQITLVGSQATQKLLVEAQSEGLSVGDRTAQAVFVSSNPKVAQVGADGAVRAAGDGAATITATVGGKKAAVTVRVTKTAAPFAWNFRNHVLPVLTKAGCNSGACHGAAAGKGGLKLTLRGYDPDADYAVLTRQALGRRVVSGDPAHSLILLKTTMTIPHGGGRRIEPASSDYRVLSSWIKAGVPQPRPDDPRPTKLEIFPELSRLHPGDAQQILVRAVYSDGHGEDVTRWVKFGTSDNSVATVDDLGRVKMTGNGEAAITVWFSSRVAFARVAAPFPSIESVSKTRPPAPNPGGVRPPTPKYGGDSSVDTLKFPRNRGLGGTFSTLPPTVPASSLKGSPGVPAAETLPPSFVDALVAKKLKTLNIPPSPLCTDSEFIRRAFLDAAGILPTPKETEAFLADASPEKRAKLVETLLAKPEYVDYWAYKWSDLLLVSSRKLQAPALTAYSGYIRKSVAENKPWSRFAREILTSTGSNLDNGAANYYVMHKDPIDLTETTTQAFLGMSLMCARCHNHPLEKWIQRDYYQMANLFARVRLKNGDKAGEVFVLTSTEGNIPHPRLGVPLPPRPLDGKEMSLDDPNDRRQQLADWLTSPENPYFAKAIVNRVWRNFMGRGLVEAEDDLRLTNPPSNQELLDALSSDFIKNGYDIKHLIRTIMLSSAYQRSANPMGINARDERYYSRYIVRRLPAEVILDALSQVTGIPTEFANYPKGTRALQLPDSQVASYFLTAFGRPDRERTCACERQQEPNVAQALHLSNGDTINMKLRASGGIIEQLIKEKAGDEKALDQLYLAALCRTPTERERKKALAVLAEAAPSATLPPAEQETARRAVLEDLFWAVLSDREFLFNH